MNETIRLLMNHRSIRKFTDQPVRPEQLSAIVGAAQMASTSSSVQAYSIIHVTDPERKRTLAALAGDQAYVSDNGAFLVWCADLYRLRHAYASQRGNPGESYADSTENLVVALVDVALAAQNAAVAAESLGLGVVYIGGIRNRIEEVARLLELPDLVIPVFGMCLGFPAQHPMVRPRLPQAAVLHENRYDPEQAESAVEEYDHTYRDYIRERSGGKRDTCWSAEMAAKMASHARPHMKDFLRSKGFGLR